jgi:hypothetical protein
MRRKTMAPALLKYRDLFERHLSRAVDEIVSASEGQAAVFREQLFGSFLEQYMFICGICGNEFAPENTAENDVVLCGDCRR